MKNRLFAGCIWAVVLAGLFVHLRDPLIEWLHSSDSAAAKELLEKGYSTNLMEFGNALHDFLIFFRRCSRSLIEVNFGWIMGS